MLWESAGQDGGRWGEEVRRFQGLTGRHSLEGKRVERGEAAFGDKASVVLPKWAETTLTL